MGNTIKAEHDMGASENKQATLDDFLAALKDNQLGA
jgi:hypothetical protein